MKLSTSPTTSGASLATAVTTLAAILCHVMQVGVAQEPQHEVRHRRRGYQGYQDASHNKPFQDVNYDDVTQVPRPEFIRTKTNITARAGNVATLPCVVRNLGTKEVVWRRLFHEGEPMVMTVGQLVWAREINLQVEHSKAPRSIQRWDLVISPVHLEDQGTYECQVTDKSPIKTFIYLLVEPKPISKPTVVLTGSEFVDAGEEIQLTCNATGGDKIPEDIDWFKDGTKLDAKSSPGVVLSKYMAIETSSLISQLTIRAAQQTDSGSYICRSSDRKIGSIKVTVLVGPDNPKDKRQTGSLTKEQRSKQPTDAACASSRSSVLAVLLGVLLALVLPRRHRLVS